MLGIQKRRRSRRDKELAAVGILAGIGHAQDAGGVVLAGKVLVGEAGAAVDRGAAGAVAVQKVAALDHKVLDDAVEFAALVALRLAGGAAGFAGAELAEVFGGARYGVGVEFDLDAAEGFTWRVERWC